MKKLWLRFERFCLRNRNKGIPNLMLYICLGTAVVALAGLINGGQILYQWLRFDKAAILRGQVWRLFSWLFTEQLLGGSLLSVLFLYFFYRLGSAVEQSIGTLKFNLFYLTGVVMLDIFFMVFGEFDALITRAMVITPPYLLHLGMVLAFSTMYPDSQFLILFVIPVKAWVIALIDLILIGISVFNMCVPNMLFPHCLFPLVGLLNYFLFFGPMMGNLLPLSWRVKLQRKRSKKATPQSSGPRVVQFTPPQRQEPKPNYTHRCTVCGRTDVTNPELEFRYCSRCNGYHCYCQDHISNHTHVEE